MDLSREADVPRSPTASDSDSLKSTPPKRAKKDNQLHKSKKAKATSSEQLSSSQPDQPTSPSNFLSELAPALPAKSNSKAPVASTRAKRNRRDGKEKVLKSKALIEFLPPRAKKGVIPTNHHEEDEDEEEEYEEETSSRLGKGKKATLHVKNSKRDQIATQRPARGRTSKKSTTTSSSSTNEVVATKKTQRNKKLETAKRASKVEGKKSRGVKGKGRKKTSEEVSLQVVYFL